MARSDNIFKARRSIKSVLIFIAVFGVFIILGIVITQTGEDMVGLGFMVFGGVAEFFMLMQIITPGSFYRLDNDALILKRTFSNRLVQVKDIAGVDTIADSEAQSVVKEYMVPSMAAESNLDLRNWYKSNKKYGRFIKFCTVPIVQSKTTAGSSLYITSFDAKTAGKFVILRLVSGEELLLSPLDAEGLAGKLSSRTGKAMDLSEKYAYRGSSGEIAVQSRGRGNKILIANLISFLVLATAAVIYFVLRR